MTSTAVEKTGGQPLDFLALIYVARDEAEARVAQLRADLSAAESELDRLNITAETATRLSEAAASVTTPETHADDTAEAPPKQDRQDEDAAAPALKAPPARRKAAVAVAAKGKPGRARKAATAAADKKKSGKTNSPTKDVLTLLGTPGTWLKPREIALSIGKPDTRSAIESVRYTLKKLVGQGDVAVNAEGRYGIPAQAHTGASPAFVEPAEPR